MKLIHFNPDYAKTFWEWYHDQRLKSFFRGYEQGASFAQIANAPAWMRCHILLGFDGDPKVTAPVGAITFAENDPVLRVFKMGLLVDPNTQHKGYGKELVSLGFDWAFNTMNAHRIFGEMLKSDPRIIQGSRAAGMIYEGTLRKSCYLFGEYLDKQIYSILAEEYHGGKNAKYNE